MANQHNKNIIYNISDFYSAKSLLDGIKSIDKEKTGSSISFKDTILEEHESKIVDEYTQMMNDIEKIKTLNGKPEDISQKIINITNIDFEIEYLKNLKVNNLNKYIDEFFNDINDTLIEKSDIDKYFTLIENKPIINNSLEKYNNQNTIFNSKYDLIYKRIKDKYTNVAIENINNIIKDNEYSDNTVTVLINQYNKYSNKDLGDAFKKRYETIMKQLVIDFGKYVYNTLNYSGTLHSLLKIPNIDTKKTAIENHIKGILDTQDPSDLHKYTTYPIISQNPNSDSRTSLLQTIAKPFVNEKIKLEKANAEADAKANKPSVFSFSK